MKMRFSTIFSAVLLSLAAGPARSQQTENEPAVKTEPRTAATPPAGKQPFVQARLLFEIGGLAPAAHTVKFSKSGSRFDYVEEGGQDNVFFFWRPSAELTLDGAHTVVLLYQPLDLETRVRLDRDIVVDEAVFPGGSGLDLRYGFDFYRLSYLYDFLGGRVRDEISIGLSLQMRNATIDFTSTDGSIHRSNRDIGPVPAIKLRGRWSITRRAWLGIEADAIYAPVKYINGSDSDVKGAFFDISLRAGYLVARSLDLFVNLRYLGGGAEGTSSEIDGPGDGYTSNWLHFIAFSIGSAWTPTDL